MSARRTCLAARPQSGSPTRRFAAENIIGEGGSVRLVYGLMQSFIATEARIGMVAIRVSEESGRENLTHTHGLSVAIRKPGKDVVVDQGLG